MAWLRRPIQRAWALLVRLRSLNREIDDLDLRLDAAVKVRDTHLESLGESLLGRDDLSELVQTFATTARELAEDHAEEEKKRKTMVAERERVLANRDAALGELDASLEAAEQKRVEKRTEKRAAAEALDAFDDDDDSEDALDAAQAHYDTLTSELKALESALETLSTKRSRRADAFEARIDDLDGHLNALSDTMTRLENRRRATLMDLGREGLSLDAEALDASRRKAAMDALVTVRAVRQERDQSVSARESLDLGPLWRAAGAMLLTAVVLGALWSALT